MQLTLALLDFSVLERITTGEDFYIIQRQKRPVASGAKQEIVSHATYTLTHTTHPSHSP